MKFRSCWSNVFPPSALTDEVVEADEMYQNAGEKGQKHEDPDDPPRRRANNFKGHGPGAMIAPRWLGSLGARVDRCGWRCVIIVIEKP